MITEQRKQLAEETGRKIITALEKGGFGYIDVEAIILRALAAQQAEHKAEIHKWLNVVCRYADNVKKVRAARNAAVAETVERAARGLDERAGICNSNRLAYNDKDCPAATAWADKERMLREEAARIRAFSPRGDLGSVPSAEALLGAIARGWCHPKNSGKEFDSDLAISIAAEVNALFAAAEAKGETSIIAGTDRTTTGAIGQP